MAQFHAENIGVVCFQKISSLMVFILPAGEQGLDCIAASCSAETSLKLSVIGKGHR